MNPTNVYVVLAGEPIVFADEHQAREYAELSGNDRTYVCAVRDAQEGAELIDLFRDEGEQ